MKRLYSCGFVCAWMLLASTVPAQTLNTLLNADLVEPFGVAVDANNDYYISDSSNNRILKFFSVSNVRSNYAGISGPGGAGFNDGPAFLARFSNPQGIVATRGGIVVADAGNHRLRIITNGIVSTIAGTGVAGAADGPGASAQFNSPSGLAVDANGVIYVADLLNNSIRKVGLDNRVTTVTNVFLRPAAVAVTPDGLGIFVADTGNNAVKLVTNGVVSLIAGSGSRFSSGFVDDVNGTNALFNGPRGLLYLSDGSGLLVSDSGNHIVRRVFNNPAVNAYSVEVFAATSGAGLVFPIGLAQNVSSDILIVDFGANALRGFVRSQAPLTDPVIGYFINLGSTNVQSPPQFLPLGIATFDNDPVIAISGDSSAATYYTLDGSAPNRSSFTAPQFTVSSNGLVSAAFAPASIITSGNHGTNVVIRAISLATGRTPSATISAQAIFQVATPAIKDDILNQIQIICDTTNAEFHYTIDGSDPLTNTTFSTTVPINLGAIATNTLLTVRAFRAGYSPSPAASKIILPDTSRLKSTVTFSRDYTGGIGSRVIIPVQLQLKPGDAIATMQYRVEVSPGLGNPPPTAPSIVSVTFTNDFVQTTITNVPGVPNTVVAYSTGSTNGLLIADLGPAGTFLLTNSAASFAAFPIGVAMLSIPIPITAAVGQTYTISIKKPSATRDAQESSLALLAGSDHTITVANNPYLVGDTAVSKGYTAGEFGNGNLNNNDVLNAFKVAVGILTVYDGTDLQDALDAYPEDTPGTAGGDGVIRLADWDIIFRRSLGLNNNNFLRIRTAGGGRTVVSTNLNDQADSAADSLSATAASDVWVSQGSVSMGTIENASPGATVQVPVYVKVTSGLAVSGAQFRADAVPVSGAPAITDALQYVPATGIQNSAVSAGLSGAVACGWPLGSFSPALHDNTLIGYVKFKIPANAAKGQYYLLQLSHVEASTARPDGSYTPYHFESAPGSVWIQSPAVTPLDIIPPDWKVQFFGDANSPLAQPDADPDGDGKSNLQEYLAGTNPAKLRFYLLDSEWRKNFSRGLKLRWFGAAGKAFIIESSPNMAQWTTVTTITGTGTIQEFMAQKAAAAIQYYRIRMVE